MYLGRCWKQVLAQMKVRMFAAPNAAYDIFNIEGRAYSYPCLRNVPLHQQTAARDTRNGRSLRNVRGRLSFTWYSSQGRSVVHTAPQRISNRTPNVANYSSSAPGHLTSLKPVAEPPNIALLSRIFPSALDCHSNHLLFPCKSPARTIHGNLLTDQQ